jgi:hypothetical protein
MKVEVVDSLTAVLTRIHDNAIAIAEPLLASNLRRSPKQVTEKRALALIGFDHGRNVLAGNDQNMHRSLGVEVGKGVSQRILEYRRRGNGTFDNLAEEAAHNDPSVQGGDCARATDAQPFVTAESKRLQADWFSRNETEIRVQCPSQWSIGVKNRPHESFFLT